MTELNGRLRLARGLALGVALLALVLVLPGTLEYYRSLTETCFQTECQLGLIRAPGLQDIAAIGLSVPAYSLLIVGVEVAYVLVHAAVAGVLYWRAPANRVALLGALFLVAWGTSITNIPSALAAAYPVWRIPLSLISIVGLISLFWFFSIFPSGTFVPAKVRRVMAAWAVVAVVLELGDSDAPVGDNFWLLCGAVLGFFGFLGSLIFAQIYRYYRVSSPTQRQQTKWVVYGLAVSLTGLSALLIVGGFVDPMPEPRALTSLGHHAAFYLVTLAVPLSLTAAILQSRLWSIDLIIRRTLIYSMCLLDVSTRC